MVYADRDGGLTLCRGGRSLHRYRELVARSRPFARDGRVHVAFRVGREAAGGDWLEIEVRDQGQGFDADTVEEPTPEKTFGGRRKRGWGLQIIKSLMDHVDISSGEWGTRILMRKYK